MFLIRQLQTAINTFLRCHSFSSKIELSESCAIIKRAGSAPTLDLPASQHGENTVTFRIMPSQDELRKILRYDPYSGHLYWLPRPDSMFSTTKAANIWNKRYANKEALSALDKDGYKYGCVFGRKYRSHRIIWMIMTGSTPKEQIDHINCIKIDNRWSNLREATCSENMRNKRIQPRNTSGYKGAYLHKASGKWISRITINKNVIYLGQYDCPIDAHNAYIEAAKIHHKEYARFE